VEEVFMHLSVSERDFKALQGSEHRYRRLFETARDGIFLLNAQTACIEDANPYLSEMLGYTRSEFLGKKIWEVGAFADAIESQEKFAELQSNGYVRYDDLPLRTRWGALIAVEFVSNSYECDGSTVIQCNIRDITARKKVEESMVELAFHDPLTHLPNRTLLMDRLKQAMIVGTRNATHAAVLLIDLDYFKLLNDTQGHDRGDSLLLEVAQRLCACVREGDTVARLGGDEFVIILEHLDPQLAQATAQAQEIGEKIVAALHQSCAMGDHEYVGTASVGVTVFCGAGESVEVLLKQADMAMYQSKAAGRNQLHFYDPSLLMCG
jgi:diguanylate cyclase (GGDEF)-like protein/PAS domain S-box-containing protein